ncbi:MAG: hypothetical protein IT342_14290 [Candidatus Melainabacteria bacterium]|nr:hypothetical protein [Candidatus Melainabacteria bacterium]
MIQEIVRALITRIMQDKILMGLVILGILAVFVVPNVGNDEKPPGHGSNAANAPPELAQAVGQEQGQLTQGVATNPEGATPGGAAAPGVQAAPTPNQVDPKLADQFVKFWMGGAMDYNTATAAQSHKEAAKWMTPEAQQAFESNFWSPDIAQAIASGQLRGAFQPISVQPKALNPDGSIVVEMTGTLVLQQSTVRPVTHQIVMDLLVRKETEGLRVAGLYNRSYVMQANNPY